jgi:ABC-type multidrug transport system ATPase subunit
VDVISCENLTKRFGPAVAVNGLDLTVPAGEVYGFLGPNGAGKPVTKLRHSAVSTLGE